MDYKRTNEKGVAYCPQSDIGYNWVMKPFYYKNAFWCEGYKFLIGSYTKGKVDRVVEASIGCNCVTLSPNEKVTHGVEELLLHRFQVKRKDSEKESGFTKMWQFIDRLLKRPEATKVYYQSGKLIDLWQINNFLGNQ